MARLKTFSIFVKTEYKMETTDDLISSLKSGQIDQYQCLNRFVSYLRKHHSLSPLTLKGQLITAKNFLEYHDIDFSPRRFRIKCKLPKIVKRIKQPLTKEDVVRILNSCFNIRLKTYVSTLASTGMRATEALSIRLKDINFDKNTISLRGEYTKTKTDRTIFMTTELATQLKTFLDWKYRRRRISARQYRVPERSDEDLIFGIRTLPDIGCIYVELRTAFAKTLDRIGMGAREEEEKRRRKITLHSFRRYVKTTISDLGFADFSEYYLGHSHSVYYTQPERERLKIFSKIAPSLTFLDVVEMERRGADIQSKIEQLEEENRRLRRREEGQMYKLLSEINRMKENMKAYGIDLDSPIPKSDVADRAEQRLREFYENRGDKHLMEQEGAEQRQQLRESVRRYNLDLAKTNSSP
jgi:integrase